MSFFNKMLNKPKLGEYQRRKLLFDFQTFFDVKRVGLLQWKDFEALQEEVLAITGWNSEDEWWQSCLEMYKEFWTLLLTKSTAKNPQHISTEEWLELWLTVVKAKQDNEKNTKKVPTPTPKKKIIPPPVEEKKDKSEKGENEHNVDENNKNLENGVVIEGESIVSIELPEIAEEKVTVVEVKYPDYLPAWTQKYFHYKFKLLDRAGDGKIDSEEFEYVLWDGLGVSPIDCREAFKVLSKDIGQTSNIGPTLDEQLFTDLLVQFYFSEASMTDPGNYVNGKRVD